MTSHFILNQHINDVRCKLLSILMQTKHIEDMRQFSTAHSENGQTSMENKIKDVSTSMLGVFF